MLNAILQRLDSLVTSVAGITVQNQRLEERVNVIETGRLPPSSIIPHQTVEANRPLSPTKSLITVPAETGSTPRSLAAVVSSKLPTGLKQVGEKADTGTKAKTVPAKAPAPAQAASTDFPALPTRPKVGVVAPPSWAAVVTSGTVRDNGNVQSFVKVGKADKDDRPKGPRSTRVTLIRDGGVTDEGVENRLLVRPARDIVMEDGD